MKRIKSEEIENNHKEYLKRVKFYNDFGLDYIQIRKNIVKHIDVNTDGILEVGTGKGLLTCLLAKISKKVITIDIDEEAQYIARLNLAYGKLLDNVCFEIRNAENLNFDDKYFDTVVSAFSFHHFEKPFKVMQEMIRITDNKLIITDFNDYGFSILDDIHHEEDREHERKTRDFDIVGVYLKDHGFHVIEDEDAWQKMYIARRKINED